MLLRFLSGLVGIPLLILLVFIGDGIPFIFGVGIISMIGLHEFYHGVRKTGANPQEWVGLVCAFLFLFSAVECFHPEKINLPALITLFVIATLFVELIRRNRSPIKNLGATFLGAIYVGWLFSYLVAINSINGHVSLIGATFGVRLGGWLVLYVIFTVWASDTGAFFVGRKWGKHKMAPTISPGKSWEGFAAGFMCSIIMSLLMGKPLNVPVLHAITIGAASCIAGTIGDLAESSLKRDIGIKDFGTIVPGHGGILDRFDSLLFAAPLFYYYVTLVLGIGN